TGADSLEGLTTWYHWEDILDLCVFVVTTRPGYALEFSDDIRAVAEKSKGGILCVEIDALDVSSTEVRERVARGQTIADLIPQAIIEEVSESMEIKVEGYKEILKNRLSVKRYTHSIGVANTAARLAGMFNGDIERAYLAGLMHDYARELTEEELLELTAKHNLSTDGVELMQTSLLHGPVGAWLLEHEGLITDKQVLDAIRWHTTGHPDMDQLARIIYISDYIEPGRNFPGVDVLRQITNKDLNLGVLAGLDHTLGFLVQRNNFIHPLSIATRNRLLEEHVVEDLS
ncbi:MAG: bis(5'-nucleosyl)-tetraphosphatase (symmetrical) YqeK, partial [Peptococcaceae bacterium]|nr:bis(5'-nucleosyl)-tetraphosphatase (symmetrical) YqeK [Peptococcaceae bacterium]